MANVISRKQISRATVYRYLKANETELVEFERDKKQKRKYSFAHSNECWQSDVKHGPHLHIESYAQRKKNMPANQPVDTGIDYLNLIEKEMNKDV
jgi:Fe2+ or Zn2+ uptake regulation protein